MENIDWLYWAAWVGSIGGFVSVASFVPQALRIYQRKSAVDVSYVMYVIVCFSNVLWMFYAAVHETVVLFLTNAAIFLIAAIIIVLKYRYRQA